MVTFNLELTFQTVDDNIQVKLTHTRDNCLTSLFVSLNCKRRIFFSQLSQAIWQFIHILLSLRLNCDTNYRFREVHRLQYNRCSFVTQCITSMYILETYASTNITSTDNFYRILLVWVHLEQTGYAFFLTRTRVIDIRTSLNLTGINAEESQTTYIRVCCNLKCQSRSLFVFARFTVFFSTSFGVCTDNVLCIQRRRQECTHVIEQCLYTFVLEWRTAKHRNDSHLHCCVTESSQNLFFCNGRRIIEIFLHQSIVKLSHFFEHLISPFISFVYQICRNFFYCIVSTHCFIMPIDSFHFDKVNKTFERFFSTDRNNNRTRISSKHILHLTNYFKEVCTRAVHLVYVGNTRYIVLVSLTPYSFWLRFYTTYCTVSSNSTIQDTQWAFYLSSKVNVSRSVNQVNFISITCILPTRSRCCRCNSNTTFLLLLHPVHSSSTIMYLTNFVSQSGIEQDTFRSCCFSGIDVSHDTDITSQM